MRTDLHLAGATALLLVAALLSPAFVHACSLPLQRDRSSGPLTFEAVAQLEGALLTAGPSACARTLLEWIPSMAPPALDAVGDVLQAWGTEVPAGLLLDAFGDAMFEPEGAAEDVAAAIARGLDWLGEDGLLAAMSEPARIEAWTALASARYRTEWGPPPEAAGEPPTRTEPPDREAFAACVASSETAPPDPFDPRGTRVGTAALLSRGTRCAAAGLLAFWDDAGSVRWRNYVQEQLGAYSPSQGAYDRLATRLEADWAQGGGAASPPRDSPPLASRRGGGVWGGAFVVALLGALAWPRTRRIAQPVVAMGLGFGALLAVEFGLGVLGVPPGDEHRPRHDMPLAIVDAQEEGRLFVDERRAAHPVPPPAGEVRLAVVGASSVAGPGLRWPESLPERIERALAERAPCVRAVNLGHHGFAMPQFRSNALNAVDELGADLVVLYGGHNEVADLREYERYSAHVGWLERVRWRARRTALFGLLDGVDSAPRLDPSAGGAPRPEPRWELSRYEPKFDAVVTHRFREELTDLARGLRRREVPWLYAVPAFNRHGLRVGYGVPGASEMQLNAAVAALSDGTPAEALAATAPLIEVAPEHATAWFLRALALERDGDLEGAEAAYWEVSRRNHMGSAVTPGVRAAGRDVAERFGLAFVDANVGLRAAAGDHLPGFDLFVDYVHLNARGSAVVGSAIAEELWRDPATRAVLSRCGVGAD